MVLLGFPGGASGKEPACHCKRHKRRRFNPWVRKIPWRRAGEPTPVFLPGESQGQRSLLGYSPWGCRVRHDWATSLTHCESEVKVLVTQSCSTLCNLRLLCPWKILQARILEEVAISFSRRSSQPRDQIHVSCLADRFFTSEPPGKFPTGFLTSSYLSVKHTVSSWMLVLLYLAYIF